MVTTSEATEKPLGVSEKPNLRQKLLAVMQDVGSIGKNGTAPATQGGYSYQKAADIFPAVQKAFLAHGVVFLASEVSAQAGEPHTTRNGAVLLMERVTMLYTILDTTSDEKWETRSSGVAFDSSDKAQNKAKTAALKYFLKQTFLIGEDGDDSETGEHGELTLKRDEVLPNDPPSFNPAAKATDAQKKPLLDLVKDRLGEEDGKKWLKDTLHAMNPPATYKTMGVSDLKYLLEEVIKFKKPEPVSEDANIDF